MHTLAVCGAGYVGLVTAACLAHIGNDVVAYDTDATKIDSLQSGASPLHEPGLQSLIDAGIANGRLRFTNDSAAALHQRELVFIAVGTPVGPLGDADLTNVRHAVRLIAQHATNDLLVVNKSTVPVETVDMVERMLEREARRGTHFRIASNPEFLREGTAVHDFLHPDRIVIGAKETSSSVLLIDVYRSIDAPIMLVDPRTAEMIKYAANAFLATKISFVNELANICGAVGADVERVLDGMAHDHRIGHHYMHPGIGFGGSCLPKDVSALAHVARSHAIEPSMLDAVLQVNRRQVALILSEIERRYGDVDGRRAAVLGLAFKANTDDVRESPSLALIEALLAHGASVSVHDPVATTRARAQLGDRVAYATTPYDACERADFIAIATAWPEYRRIDWRRIAAVVSGRFVFDCVRIAERSEIRNAGMTHVVGIGGANGRDEARSA